jgi:carbonic anhydrase/acetyltransferase-like protein (isoleucine patch superfamily)
VQAETERTGARIASLGAHTPDVADDAFIASGATVIGRVHIGARSSVWYGAVLRGDVADISIGEDTNIQDGCVGHADEGYPLEIGDRVTVGHRVVVHGCRIADDVLVGMGAVLMNGVTVGAGSLIAAGAVVTQDTEIPPGSLVAGVPAKVRRQVGDAERELITGGAQHYVELAAQHRDLYRAAAPASGPPAPAS